jgi:hypothetical protein
MGLEITTSGTMPNEWPEGARSKKTPGEAGDDLSRNPYICQYSCECSVTNHFRKAPELNDELRSQWGTLRT